MTTSTALPTSPEAVAGPRDLRRSSRYLAALLMPVGPAAVGLLRYNLPYFSADNAEEAVGMVYADLGAQSLVLWLGLAAGLTLVPGAYAVGRLTHRRAPRLTAAAMLLLVPGYLALSLMLGSDLVLWVSAQAGIPQAQAVALYETTHPSTGVALGVFVFGHIIGTVVLGILLFRTRQIGRTVAVLLAVSQPLHFVAGIIVGNQTLDLVAWGLTAVGMAAAALAIVRIPDDDWDLPPQ